MEKQVYTEFDLGSTSSRNTINTHDLDAVRKEEAKLKKDGRLFTAFGLIALLSGVGLLFNGPLFAAFGEDPLIILGVAGVTAAAVGFFKLVRSVRKKTLNFPVVKMLRKAFSPKREDAEETPFQETTYKKKRLSKSSKNRVVFGVLGGLADYTGVSPSTLRLIFIIAFFATGGSLFFPYLVMSFVLPFFREYSKLK